MEKSKVYIVKCENYDEEKVYKKVLKILEGITDLGNLIKKKKVLIKPNILAKVPPEKGITTHPSIILAVCKIVKKCGGIPSIGDSCGQGINNPPKTLEKVYDITGMKYVSSQTGAELLSFEDYKEVRSENLKIIKSFKIAKPVLEADLIINIPKLKTHSLVSYTGAIKNMFGAIPGLEKSKMHLRLKEDVNLFSQMLVDLFRLTSPYISILDGVLALEGDGPGPSGKPRKVNIIAGSCDGVALDAVASYIIGFSPFDILTTKFAHQQKIGKGKLEEIEIIGEKIENLIIPDFQHPKGASILNRFPPFMRELMKDLVTAKPKIEEELCKACRICEKACPSKAIKVDKYAKIQDKICIRCYCCSELCPEKAVDLRTPFLGNILKYI